MPWSSGSRWSTIARNSSRATVLGSWSGPSSSTTRSCWSGTSSSRRSSSASTGVIARRMSLIGSASGDERTASAVIRDSPSGPFRPDRAASPTGFRAGRSRTWRRTRSSTPETRRTSPSASSRRSGSSMSRIDGMTASTKPIRPDDVLRSKRAGVVVDEVFDERLRLRDGGLPDLRRLADDLVGILAVGELDDADVLELDARTCRPGAGR